MGNCVQCYPCYIKSNLANNQSSLYVPPLINEAEKKEQNDINLNTDNNLNPNELKLNNIDKTLNYGPTLEKNDMEENFSPVNNNNKEEDKIPPDKKKNLNFLHLNNDANQRRRLSLISAHSNKVNNKYDKLKIFS